MLLDVHADLLFFQLFDKCRLLEVMKNCEIWNDLLKTLLKQVAVEVNNSIENIGARRLHTIMEKIVEDISFSAPDFKMDKDHNETIYTSDSGKDLKADDVEVVIDREDVEKAVSDLMQKRDLMKYVL